MSGKRNATQLEKDLVNFGKIGLDSMCFIYLFSDNPTFSPLIEPVFNLIGSSKLQGVTSMITIIETLVLPEAANNQLLISEYEKVFTQLPNLHIMPVDWHVCRVAAKLRSTYRSLRTPDAIQMATALVKDCAVFLTNDKKLKQVKEIKVLLLSDYI
jgi:predicted nucleic acid-binding protein